jgi:hypothetical protein
MQWHCIYFKIFRVVSLRNEYAGILISFDYLVLLQVVNHFKIQCEKGTLSVDIFTNSSFLQI